jgi:hypothetical protein
MKMIKSLLLGTLAASLALSAASAQVPSFSPPPLQVPTYSAAAHFVPAVTASKDIFTVSGSATKTVRVTRLQCSGTSTAAAAIPVVLNKYAAAATGGTATTLTAVGSDSSDSAATSVVKAYTAAPTNGTGGGAVRAGTLQTDVPTGATANPLSYVFAGVIPERMGMILRGAAQNLTLTVGATALSAGTALDCFVEWTEQ